jgi:hypothetical protein
LLLRGCFPEEESQPEDMQPQGAADKHMFAMYNILQHNHGPV